VLRFLTAWTGVKPANVTSWRASVTGDLTTAFDFRHPDFSIPRNIPTLDQTWALTQLTGGSTAPPAEGAQKMPAQECGTRPHRPTNYQLHADVTVDRTTSQVTAALTNLGKVGASLSVYPDAVVPFVPTPFTVLPSAPGSYVWDDFKGHTQTVAVKSGKSKTIGWPTDQDGYYDVVITATSAGGFRRRYAGRIA
jgi:phospholipase C